MRCTASLLLLLLQFTQTCGDVSPLSGDQPYPCLAIGGCDKDFPNQCYKYKPGSDNTPITGNEAKDLALCCVSWTGRSRFGW